MGTGQDYDPRYQRPVTPPQWQGAQRDPWRDAAERADPEKVARMRARADAQMAALPPRHPQQYQAYGAPAVPQQPARRQLTAAEAFWYILGCVPMGAMYLCKVPCKKALADAGMAQMTAAEKFWYVLMCIPMGLGYFCKLPVSKALTEMQAR